MREAELAGRWVWVRGGGGGGINGREIWSFYDMLCMLRHKHNTHSDTHTCKVRAHTQTNTFACKTMCRCVIACIVCFC